MPDTTLLRLVIDRIAASPPADGVADLVLAAFAGAGAVNDALAGEVGSVVKPAAVAKPKAPATVFLTSIEVEGAMRDEASRTHVYSKNGVLTVSLRCVILVPSLRRR